MIPIIYKTLRLFQPDQRRRLVWLVAAMVVSALIETAGIASVIPFLAVVANPSVVTENPYLAYAYERSGAATIDGFLIILGLFFIVMMVASNAARALTMWATVRFQWRNHEIISHRLLESDLRAPYAFHLRHNSARLGKELLGEVSRVVGHVFIPLTRVVARGVAAVFIVALLIIADPLLAILASVFIGGFYALVYVKVRRRQGALGEDVSRAKTQRYQIANEALGGVKELQVLGREGLFLERFRSVSDRHARAHVANSVVGLVPRFVLDTLSYAGIVAVILYLLTTRQALDQVLPLLALYAFGANRLIPAAQEIFGSLAEVRFHASALDELLADLAIQPRRVLPTGAHGPRAGLSRSLAPERSIRLEKVTFSYSEDRGPVLHDLTLEIPARSLCGLVGATGSGKTTLVDLLLGFFVPTGGTIWIEDEELVEAKFPLWRREVGYVPQHIFLCDASVAENIAFGVPREEIDQAAVERAARAAHIHDFVQTLPDGYETAVGERGVRLSGGQRQRIGIARALYHDPSVLVMDEATSALDNATEDHVMQAIRELRGGRTILMIAHRLSTVKECDIVFHLEGGRLVGQGTFDELMATDRQFRVVARSAL